MTETRSAASRNQTAALAGLLTLVFLVLISPLGWGYLLPQIGDVLATAWSTLGTALAWSWSNIIAPVFALIGGLFA